MTKSKKEYLDSLWFDTEVYTWLKLLAGGERQKASDYMNKLQETFEEKYSGGVCRRYIFWQGNKIAEKLSKELESWNEYMEYLKTFSDEMVEAMYETDIFDSYMAKNLLR